MTATPHRRTLLSAALASPFVAAALGSKAPAQAPMMGASGQSHRRFALGAFEVTTMVEGARPVDGPQNIFGMNVSAETFSEVSEANRLPADKMVIPFTPSVVNTGQALVLFDTGNSAEGITTALATAGYRPDQITHVVITHMHPDHIGGLMRDGAPTFEQAEIITGQAEFDAWAATGNDLFEANIRPLADRITMVGDGAEPITGLSGHAAFGHTPGHMIWRVESDGKAVIVAADTANHYVYSLAYPDWEVLFDMDKAAAAATRRKIFGMIADDKLPFIGYHMPYPGVGYVDRRGDGFHYVPESYQLSL